jgi:hypothetical protein
MDFNNVYVCRYKRKKNEDEEFVDIKGRRTRMRNEEYQRSKNIEDVRRYEDEGIHSKD